MEGYILCLINWYIDHRKYEMKYLNIPDAEAVLKSFCGNTIFASDTKI